MHMVLRFLKILEIKKVPSGRCALKNAWLPCATQVSTLLQNEDAQIEPAFLPKEKSAASFQGNNVTLCGTYILANYGTECNHVVFAVRNLSVKAMKP